MKRISKAMLFVLSLVVLCSCNPVTFVSGFERLAGSTTSCRTPNSTFCGIDYPVPDAIATLVTIIEQEVSTLARDIDGNEACSAVKKEILCAQRFPRCEDDSVILSSTPNCMSNLEASCSLQSYDSDSATFCGLPDATIRLGTCSALNSFSSEPFYECGAIGEETQVTEWMYEFIRFRDRQLNKVIGNGTPLDQLASRCLDDYAIYFCQLLGRCSEDGSNVVVLNEYESCESTVNCFDQELASTISEALPCEQWLDSNLHYPPLAATDPVVDGATTQRPVPTPSREPSIPPLPGSGATLPQCTLALLFVGLLLALIM